MYSSNNKPMKNRREFLQKSALGLAGVLTAPTWLQGAPALIKSLGKPNSRINGVQIGCITYSFRSMADQSAEATLQYVLDSGISSIELMGDPAGPCQCLADQYCCVAITRVLQERPRTPQL